MTTIRSTPIFLSTWLSMFALIAAIGGVDYYRNRSELRGAVKEAEKANESANKADETARGITRQYSEVVQAAIVSSIEVKLGEQESLDSLREKPHLVREIKAFGMRLAEVLKDVQEDKRTTYGLVVAALDPYLNRDYAAALSLLEKVDQKDRYRFSYAYMRGVCLLRREDPKEAATWFGIASGLTGGIQQAVSLNAHGVSKLFEWRSTHDVERLNEAINIFEGVTKAYEKYAPAYFNLAASIAQQGNGDYARVTRELMFPVGIGARPIRHVVARLHDDLVNPNERFLAAYVRDYLGVGASEADASWAEKVEKALREKSRPQ